MNKAKSPTGGKASRLNAHLLRVLMPLVLAAVASAELVSWYPPHAQLVKAYPYNSTHFAAASPDSVVFIAQVGLSFNGTKVESQAAVQYLHAMCNYVAVDVHIASAVKRSVVWIGDVYCSRDGKSWLWLKWLPLRFAAYRGFVNFTPVNATVTTPVGVFANVVPEGWYLDTTTKVVVKLPGENLTLVRRYWEMEATIQRLRGELQEALSTEANISAIVQRLRSQVDELKRQKDSLEHVLRQRESQLVALQANLRHAMAEAEALRREVEKLKAEKEALQKRVAELNHSYISQINSLEAQLVALSARQPTREAGGLPTYVIVGVVGAAALVVTALLVRKRREE
ncbi:MAG: hypothetical protein ABWK05_08425 [Pyrobaculum sp.]